MPERGDADAAHVGGRPRSDAVEAGDDRVEQTRRVVLDAAVGRERGGIGNLVEAPRDGPAGAVVERGARGRGPDVERDDHWGKIAPMAESWEVLTLRGLASADERAQEFTGTLVIHRLGDAEPVESVQVTIKRSVLTELHDTLGRLLARSTGIARRQT